MKRKTDRWHEAEEPLATFDFWIFLKAVAYTLIGLGIGYYLWG